MSAKLEGLSLPPEWIVKWSSVHALMLVPTAFASVREVSAWPVLSIASLSLLFLLLLARQKLGRIPLWNWANGVSVLRWGGIVFLALAAPRLQGGFFFGGGILLMLLDGLDGRLARRQGTATELGEYLDKEIDSLFLLVVCLSLVAEGLVGPWIIIIGLSRYLFVVALFFFKPVRPKESRSLRARFIYSGTLLILLSLFLPFPFSRSWTALGCAAIILFSFLRDIWQLFIGKDNG